MCLPFRAALAGIFSRCFAVLGDTFLDIDVWHGKQSIREGGETVVFL
jgi:hypothetical protein